MIKGNEMDKPMMIYPYQCLVETLENVIRDLQSAKWVPAFDLLDGHDLKMDIVLTLTNKEVPFYEYRFYATMESETVKERPQTASEIARHFVGVPSIPLMHGDSDVD